MKKLMTMTFAVGMIFFSSCKTQNEPLSEEINPIPLAQLEMRGELHTRIAKNYARLEETRFQPKFVFYTDEESGNWPGDIEGRTMLGLVMAAQVAGREPLYLEEIIAQIPEHLNEKGYFGKIYPDGVMSEQQLAGNGWVLRALCEYSDWKNDPDVLEIVKTLSRNLFLPGKGLYSKYPIQNNSRKMDGGMIGHNQYTENGWTVSADVGCVFIGMAGAIHAYQYTKDPELKEVIDEMIVRFLEIDMFGIKIQVHAGLTALLGLVRYAEITDNNQLMNEVEKRWHEYVKYGMTENYEIYNWFGIYNAHTESCGLIDSYMIATALWQHTQKPEYLAYLDLIYYNAICHTNRSNGGLGCDNNPGITTDYIAVKAYEAWWCCTMRGGEGLPRVAESSYFTEGKTIFVTRHSRNNADFQLGNASLRIEQTSKFPFNGETQLVIAKADKAEEVVIKLNALTDFTENFKITVNGNEVPIELDKGFAVLSHAWKTGDVIDVSFDETLRFEGTINKDNTSEKQKRLFYGPLLLGYQGEQSIALKESDLPKIKLTNDKSYKVANLKFQRPLVFKIEGTDYKLSPLYHAMAPDVKEETYHKQFLFEANPKIKDKRTLEVEKKLW